MTTSNQDASSDKTYFPTEIIYYQTKNATVTNSHVMIGQANVLPLSDVESISSRISIRGIAFGWLTGLKSIVSGDTSINIIFGLIVLGSGAFCLLFISEYYGNATCLRFLGLIILIYGVFYFGWSRPQDLLFETSSGETKVVTVKGKNQARKITEAVNEALTGKKAQIDLTLFNERRAVVEELSPGIVNALDNFAKGKWGGKYSIYYTQSIVPDSEVTSFEWLIRSHTRKSVKDGEDLYSFYRVELVFNKQTATPSHCKIYCKDRTFDLKVDEFSEIALFRALASFRTDRIRDKKGNPAYMPDWYFDKKFGRVQVAKFSTTLLAVRQKVAEQVNPYVADALEEFGSKIWSGKIIVLYDKNKDDANAVIGCINWTVRPRKVVTISTENDQDWIEYPYYVVSLFFDGEKPDHFTVFFKGGGQTTEDFDDPVSETALKRVLNQVIYDMRQPDIERTVVDFEKERFQEREVKRLR